MNYLFENKLNEIIKGCSLKDVIKEFSIETSHFMGKAHCKNKVGKCQPWNDILIENTFFN